MQLSWFLPSPRLSLCLIALGSGVLAAWAARHHIQGRIEQIEAASRSQTVLRLVAGQDLIAGTRLDADSLAVREIPAQWDASTALTPDEFDTVAGSVLAHELRRGDLVLRAHVAPAHRPALSGRVADGRRAITIPVDDISSQAGMLQAGDLLDLYVSFEHRGKRVTAPLLQGALVLATGSQSAGGYTGDDDGQPSAYATVTLDASPEDAVKLVAARQAGSITAILRNHRDGTPVSAAARGDLASLLKLDVGEASVPRIPVWYGDAADASASEAAQDALRGSGHQGLFDADVPPGLASEKRRRGPASRPAASPQAWPVARGAASAPAAPAAR